MQIIHVPELDAMGDRFTALPKTPLRVTLRTLQPIVGTEPLHLDGLLAKAVVIEALQGKPLAATADAYWLPLPLELERIHNDLPLWQSTDFRPLNPAQDNTHYHQRSDSNPYDLPAVYTTLSDKKKRRMPPTTEGQYMSYRIPIQRTTADCWQADCIGNRGEILRLLAYMQYVGKKGAQGYGRVLSWDAVEIPSFSFGDRPIPLQSSDDLLRAGSAQMMGWTPPYWHRGLWAMCTQGDAVQYPARST